ncbi:hypothetical protein Pryu01_00027 [Paraliobacillus ryukyuensis]|uniref:Uncharacterized protein DUF3397 n=1 Tax=Paraliobacillus ryukyuensis TaxID=200904 RepID=A0A366EHH4_9BACI|nr:DUF3397 domain-containing protein [Paraliobacillus ryukyuensis]RBP01901.1 uncharacterized protein DUF3397 [Paraliobacillus ryukyuensis]
MTKVIGTLLALMVTFPIFATISIYYMIKWTTGNKKRALHRSITYTTIFYILSVMMMLQTLFGSGYLGLIIILLLFGLMTTVIVQWKLTETIIFKRAWKIFWRATFLIFFLGHFILGTVGIIITMING